jgi:hypothetical protein
MVNEIIGVENTISHAGEEYVFVGDVPNSRKRKCRNLKHDAGRKCIFKATSFKWVHVYVSKIFYSDFCKTMYPYHGTDFLVEGIRDV